MIMLFPIFGTLVYIIMFITLIFGKTFRNIITEQKKAAPYYKQDEPVIQEIQNLNV